VSNWDTLLQFDLTSGNIGASKKTIWINPYYNSDPFIPSYYLTQHQLGPDGKIYISLAYNVIPNSVYSSINQNLCVINNPDVVGVGCNFNPISFNLGGKRTLGGLPNIPNYNLCSLEGSPCDTIPVGIKDKDSKDFSFKIYPNPNDGNMQIDYELSEEDTGELIIIDLMGRKLKTYYLFENKNKIKISEGALKNGLYFYQIIINDQIISVDKFIIQHK